MLFAVKNLNIYHTNPSVHGMNTSQQNQLHITTVRLLSVLRSVYYKVAPEIFWNGAAICRAVVVVQNIGRW
jgi:hypothetical protein